MNLKDWKLLAIRVLVTFVEAAGAYLFVQDGLDKAALVGGVGAGLSALYNLGRNHYPDLFKFGIVK